MSLILESLVLPNISALLPSKPPPTVPIALENAVGGITRLQARVRGALIRLKALRDLYADYPDFRDYEAKMAQQSQGAIRQLHYIGVLKRFCSCIQRYHRKRQAIARISRAVYRWWRNFKLNRDYVKRRYGCRLYFCEKHIDVMQFVLMSVLRSHDHVEARPRPEYRALEGGRQIYRMKTSFLRRELLREGAVMSGVRGTLSMLRYADDHQLKRLKRLRFRQPHLRSNLWSKANYGVRYYQNLDKLTSYYSEDLNFLTRFYISLCRSGALFNLFGETDLITVAAANELRRFWLGRYYRTKLTKIVINRFINKRAAVVLQRWWRNQVGLLRRFRALSRIMNAVRSIQDSTVYIDLLTFYQLITRDKLSTVFNSGAFYPELRGVPVINVNGEVFFQAKERYNKFYAKESTEVLPSVERGFLKWPAFLKLSKEIRYDSVLYKSVRVNYEEKSSQSISALNVGSESRLLYNLLCTGCKVGMKEFDISSKHKFRMVQLSYASVHEARARAMMLAVATLDLSSECGVELVDNSNVIQRLPIFREIYNEIGSDEKGYETSIIARISDYFRMISTHGFSQFNFIDTLLEQPESIIRLAYTNDVRPKWLLQEPRTAEDVVKFHFLQESLCYHHSIAPRRSKPVKFVRPWSAKVPDGPIVPANKKRSDLSAAKYKLNSAVDVSGRDFWIQWEAGLLKTGIDEDDLRVAPLRRDLSADILEAFDKDQIVIGQMPMSDDFVEDDRPKTQGVVRLNKRVLSIEKTLLWCVESGNHRISKGTVEEVTKQMGALTFKLESIRATSESERAAADRWDETMQHKLAVLEQDAKASPRPLSPFFPGSVLYKPMVQSLNGPVDDFAPNNPRAFITGDVEKKCSSVDELLDLKAREAQALRLSLEAMQRSKSAAEQETIEERRLRVLEMRNSPRSKDARRELKSRSGALRREERAKIEEIIQQGDAERLSDLKGMVDTQKQAQQTASLRLKLRAHSRHGAAMLNTISKAGDRAVIHNVKRKNRPGRRDHSAFQLPLETDDLEAMSPSPPQSPPITGSQLALKLMMRKKTPAMTDSGMLSLIDKNRVEGDDIIYLGDEIDDK